MQYSDLKLLGDICFVVGGISILFGVIAYFWEERWFGYFPIHPYRNYAFPLVFIGIVLFVIGYVVMERVREEEKRHQALT